jgi:hypothetical protein
MYKFKNKGVGVPSSYMNNCIRPRVITLFSWPFASSKVATTYNNNKGILSTFELFKHLTSDNGKWSRSYNWTMVNTTPIIVNHLASHPNLEYQPHFCFSWLQHLMPLLGQNCLTVPTLWLIFTTRHFSSLRCWQNFREKHVQIRFQTVTKTPTQNQTSSQNQTWIKSCPFNTKVLPRAHY